MLGLWQFFILSKRGDVIVNRALRGDVKSSNQEDFFRHVQTNSVEENLESSKCSPIFQIDDVNFAHIKASNLYFVLTSKFNNSPGYMISLLERITKILEDYCGILNEISLRKNFILVYELLDEILDFGCNFYTVF